MAINKSNLCYRLRTATRFAFKDRCNLIENKFDLGATDLKPQRGSTNIKDVEEFEEGFGRRPYLFIAVCWRGTCATA
jgi:hypothetical protein